MDSSCVCVCLCIFFGEQTLFSAMITISFCIQCFVFWWCAHGCKCVCVCAVCLCLYSFTHICCCMRLLNFCFVSMAKTLRALCDGKWKCIMSYHQQIYVCECIYTCMYEEKEIHMLATLNAKKQKRKRALSDERSGCYCCCCSLLPIFLVFLVLFYAY